MSADEMPLSGLRVIDLGHALAGPFAATMLADFGADVIKVERPGVGDGLRRLGPKKHGVPLWWKAAGRNKRTITLDFHHAEGRQVLLELLAKSDVLIENYRPGTLERHSLGWDDLHAAFPRLVMLRISGFGQTGSAASRPGFGRLADAMSGAAHLTGDPTGPPVHVGFSLADTLVGVMGAFAVMTALRARDAYGEGDCIDLALFEPLFRLIDWQVICYQQLGEAAIRAGARFPTVLEGVASSTVQTTDGVWLTYSAATDSVLARLVVVVLGQRELVDGVYSTQQGRAKHRYDIESATDVWISKRSAADVEEAFGAEHVPIARVLDMADIWADPIYAARNDIVHAHDPELGDIAMHAVLPHLVRRPGRVRWPGRGLGEDTDAVLYELLGLSSSEVAVLREDGVV